MAMEQDERSVEPAIASYSDDDIDDDFEVSLTMLIWRCCC